MNIKIVLIGLMLLAAVALSSCAGYVGYGYPYYDDYYYGYSYPYFSFHYYGHPYYHGHHHNRG